ncbi:hypothetical protein HanIR_Chr08g0388831 [Helianthus annuus]|nr:hypothetical protein HanIR_Chr08g0388831 [Helianthus annuus]
MLFVEPSTTSSLSLWHKHKQKPKHQGFDLGLGFVLVSKDSVWVNILPLLRDLLESSTMLETPMRLPRVMLLS